MKKKKKKKSTTSLTRNSQITFVSILFAAMWKETRKGRCTYWTGDGGGNSGAATRMQLVRRVLLLYICFHVFICIYNSTWCTSKLPCVCVFLLLLAPFLIALYANEKIERKNE